MKGPFNATSVSSQTIMRRSSPGNESIPCGTLFSFRDDAGERLHVQVTPEMEQHMRQYLELVPRRRR